MRSPCSPTTTDMDVSSNGSSNDVGSARTCFLQYDVEVRLYIRLGRKNRITHESNIPKETLIGVLGFN